jgi:two-component system chemotaxis sensor kinase CheA
VASRRRHAPLQGRHRPAPTPTCWTCSPSTSRASRCAGTAGPGYGFHDGAPGAPPEQKPPPADLGYGFFDDAPGAPGSATPPGTRCRRRPPHRPRPRRRQPAGARAAEKAAGHAESSTLRVSVEKVDQLINLVGELVITQAMLAQNSKGVDAALYQQMASGLADLERNTRDLQEAVMSIRMIPMSLVFNRFPRMLRDLAGKLGKKVELVHPGRSHRAGQGPGREDHRPADPPGAQQLRPRHRDAGRAAAKGKPETRHHHAGRQPPGRQHRHRGARRRQGPEPRQAAQEGARARHGRADAMTDQEVWA